MKRTLIKSFKSFCDSFKELEVTAINFLDHIQSHIGVYNLLDVVGLSG